MQSLVAGYEGLSELFLIPMPVFFISSSFIQNDHVSIGDPLFSHLYKSLRVKPGETLWFGDEQRTRYLAHVRSIGSNHLIADILEKHAGPAPSGPQLIVGQAILKNHQMNWAIQKAIELGVRTLMPVITARTVIDCKSSRLQAYQERWQRIALEAAQQSEQWTIPEVTLPYSMTDFCQKTREAAVCSLLVERHEGPGLHTLPLAQKPEEQIVVTIGPEGGWTTEELRIAQENGFHTVTLGEHILRAETATIAATTIIQNRLGNLG